MNSDFSYLANLFRQTADELYNDFDLSKASRSVWAVKPEAALSYSKKHGAAVSLTSCRKLSLALGGLRGNGRHPIERELVENAAGEILELAEWFDAKALEVEKPQIGIDHTSLDESAILKEVVQGIASGGLAGVLNLADGAKAVDKADAAMREKIADDSRCREWTADDWASKLKRTKRTILGTPCWREIHPMKPVS